MVNFRKEVRVSNCTTRGRTNYDSWKRTLAVPGANFAQLNYLERAYQDLLNRLSFRGKALTGWRMAGNKRRTDFSAYRPNLYRSRDPPRRNHPYHGGQGRPYARTPYQNEKPTPPSAGGNRT